MRTKVGIIGCGVISDIYIQNSKKFDNYEVVACADAARTRAAAKAAEYGIAKVLTVEELLKDPEIEVVLNLTNPQAHAEIDIAALRAGKHVYSEKPLAVSLAEGKSILAAQGDRLLGCAPDTFLGGRLQTFRTLLDAGSIGSIVGGFLSMANHGHEGWHPGPEFYYKKGAGPLFDMGPYYLTALVTLLGPVLRVTGMARTSFPQRVITSEPLSGQRIDVEVPTHLAATLEMAGGALITLVLSFDVWDSHLPRFELYGSEGTISLSDADPLAGPNIFGGVLDVRHREESDWSGFPASLPRKPKATDWKVVAPEFAYNENSRGVGLADMVAALQKGRRPRADGSIAFHVLEVMHGILESAESGTAYRLTSTCERPRALLKGDREYRIGD